MTQETTSTRQRVGKNASLTEPHRKSSNLTYKDVDNDEKVAKGVAYAQSLAFVTLGALTVYSSDTVSVVTSPHPLLDRGWFVVGSAFTAVYLALFVYIGFWLYGRQGIPIDYKILSQYSPWLIPLATCSVFLSGLAYLVAFWHVWAFWTPLVLISEWFGFIALLSLVT